LNGAPKATTLSPGDAEPRFGEMLINAACSLEDAGNQRGRVQCPPMELTTR
jgi:hypothetical protein